MRHGFRGAAEIAETVDNLYLFAATSGVVADRHFDLMFDAVTCAIPGAKRPSQVEENVFAGDLSPLSEETMNAVRELYETRIRPLVHHYW